MNIGLIGLGYWGKNILRNLRNNSLSKHIFCLDPYINKNFNNSNISFFDKEKEFFSRKEIDGYIIASPAETHFYYIKKILKINKFLCVTKPVFKNYEQLEFIKKKFKNYQKIFADHTYIYHPALKVIKNYIDKKILGKIIYYNSDRSSFGKFYKNQSVVDDLAVHDFYILSYLFPKIKFKKATLISNDSFYNQNYFSVVNLKNNNFFASIKATWHSPYKVRKVVIAGSKKTLIFDDALSDNKITIYSKSINILKKKSYIWEYRIGDLFSPFVENKESLNTMLNNFFFFIKNYKSKKIITNFKHLERVYNIFKLLRKK